MSRGVFRPLRFRSRALFAEAPILEQGRRGWGCWVLDRLVNMAGFAGDLVLVARRYAEGQQKLEQFAPRLAS
eukprot:2082968-Lingulodinium_polyedra.AAC.1